jgi:eukaryotic-like serine/threonine-protein kinase
MVPALATLYTICLGVSVSTPLQPGDKLASYELLTLLGSGGMGAVWKARDPRLGRMVAIKVLREEEHGDLTRLIQEARAAAQLNHPNIVTVHEIGEHEGRVFVVMEFIDGRVLSDVFGTGGMPLNDALKFAIPIARALEAAHKAGIVHRDLKPNNVMVTAAGDVKLVDFGLAKVIRPMEVAESGEATATLLDRPSTAKGQILGTIAYMSPEQAQGKTIDARSDIFSFGTLFYEMLTGRRPFRGQNNVATLASILRDEPPMPGMADPILSRCLRKDPERRFQTAADLRAALDDLREESASRSLAVPAPVRRTPAWFWMAGAAALVAIGTIAWWFSRTPKTRDIEALQQVTFDGGISATPAISTDGKLLAFASDRGGAGNLDLWLRQTAGGGLVRLTSQPGLEYSPQFSPDGTRLYYLTGSQSIFEMPAIGGPARKVVDDAGPFSISSKGEIIFCRLMPAARPGPIFLISAPGAAPEPWHPECKSWPQPAWSEDGTQVAFAGDCGQKPHALFVVARSGGTAVPASDLPAGPGALFYAAPRWLPKSNNREGIFCMGGRLVRFDLNGKTSPLPTQSGIPRWPALSAQGDLTFAVAEEQHGIWSLPLDAHGLAPDSNPTSVVNAMGHFSVSRDGKTLVYGRLTSSTAGELVVKIMDGAGDEKVFAEHDLLNVSIGSIWPQISPDGSRIFYRVVGERGGHYLLRSDTGETRRVATLQQFQLASDWSADGKRILGECAGPRAGICEIDEESGAVKPLLVHATDQLLYPSWSWDGRALTFMRRQPGGRAAIWVAGVTAAGQVVPEAAWAQISPPKTDNSRPRFSPDGGVIYYIMGRDGERLLAAQRIDKTTYKPSGEVQLPLRTPIEITALTAGSGPYPLVSVSAKRLYYSTVSLSGNLFKARID